MRKKFFIFLILSLFIIGGINYFRASDTNAVVYLVVGKVYIKRGNNIQRARIRTTIRPGDIITTDKNSECIIRYSDGSRIRLGEKTSVQISSNLVEKRNVFAVYYGKIKANIAKQKKDNFVFYTPTSVAGVRGTEFTLEVDESTGDTDLDLAKGSVDVSNQDTTVAVNNSGHVHTPLGGKPSRNRGQRTTDDKYQSSLSDQIAYLKRRLQRLRMGMRKLQGNRNRASAAKVIRRAKQNTQDGMFLSYSLSNNTRHVKQYCPNRQKVKGIDKYIKEIDQIAKVNEEVMKEIKRIEREYLKEKKRIDDEFDNLLKDMNKKFDNK